MINNKIHLHNKSTLMQGGFSKAYQEKGVARFYEQEGGKYKNPHAYDIERIIRKKLTPPNKFLSPDDTILDLACGGGEATLPLLSLGYKRIEATDPYTAALFTENTKIKCQMYSFMDIINGCYQQKHFNCIVCSYALHLVKDSLLHDFCTQLSQLSDKLIIISPHKFPVIKQSYGWEQHENYVQDKVHFRFFTSTYKPESEAVLENEE